MFKPISDCNVIPVNSKVLLRVEIKGFSTFKLLNAENVKGEDIEDRIYYVAGTSVEHIPLGARVHIGYGGDVRFLTYIPNNRSLTIVSKEYEDLSVLEKKEFITANPRVDLVEYMLVDAFVIEAIIN